MKQILNYKYKIYIIFLSILNKVSIKLDVLKINFFFYKKLICGNIYKHFRMYNSIATSTIRILLHETFQATNDFGV